MYIITCCNVKELCVSQRGYLCLMLTVTGPRHFKNKTMNTVDSTNQLAEIAMTEGHVKYETRRAPTAYSVCLLGAARLPHFLNCQFKSA
jgi:hypothetical protein